jgi:hypothetical protein
MHQSFSDAREEPLPNAAAAEFPELSEPREETESNEPHKNTLLTLPNSVLLHLLDPALGLGGQEVAALSATNREWRHLLRTELSEPQRFWYMVAEPYLHLKLGAHATYVGHASYGCARLGAAGRQALERHMRAKMRALRVAGLPLPPRRTSHMVECVRELHALVNSPFFTSAPAPAGQLTIAGRHHEPQRLPHRFLVQLAYQHLHAHPISHRGLTRFSPLNPTRSPQAQQISQLMRDLLLPDDATVLLTLTREQQCIDISHALQDLAHANALRPVLAQDPLNGAACLLRLHSLVAWNRWNAPTSEDLQITLPAVILAKLRLRLIRLYDYHAPMIRRYTDLVDAFWALPRDARYKLLPKYVERGLDLNGVGPVRVPRPQATDVDQRLRVRMLEHALAERDDKLALLLIQHGASVDQDAIFPLNPMIRACQVGDADLVSWLMLVGADVRRHASFPLVVASRQVRLSSAMQEMVALGAGVRAPVLFNLVTTGNRACLIWMVQHADADVKCLDSGGNSLLHAAITHGHLDIASYLVREGGLDVHARNAEGKSPLDLANSLLPLRVADWLTNGCRWSPNTLPTRGVPPLVRSVSLP